MIRRRGRLSLLVLSIGLSGIVGGAAGTALPSPRPPSGAGARPNLLVITIETLRADRVGSYGGSLKTANIDRLAERGVVFRRAFAPVPTTLPSQISLFLGLGPLRHGVHDNSNFIVGPEVLTLAEHLKAAGYATAAFIGGFPLDSRFGPAQGFDVYDETLEEHGSNELFYRERKAEAVLDRSLEWLAGRPGPWFAWVHLFDPHHPYQPPEPFLSRYKDRPYDGEVAYVDEALKKLDAEFLGQNRDRKGDRDNGVGGTDRRALSHADEPETAVVESSPQEIVEESREHKVEADHDGDIDECREPLPAADPYHKDQCQEIRDQGDEDCSRERDIPHRFLEEDGLCAPGHGTQDGEEDAGIHV